MHYPAPVRTGNFCPVPAPVLFKIASANRVRQKAKLPLHSFCILKQTTRPH